MNTFWKNKQTGVWVFRNFILNEKQVKSIKGCFPDLSLKYDKRSKLREYYKKATELDVLQLRWDVVHEWERSLMA